MAWTSLVGVVTTVLSFAVFVLVVWWAYGSARRDRFEAAAREPFALPDEAVDAPAPPQRSGG